MKETILSTLSEHVLQLTINRPAQKNALDLAMYSRLAEHLETAAVDPQIRVVLLAGSEGCFSSGNDLKDFIEPDVALGDDHPVIRFMKALSGCPKTVVVAVEGFAIGIGTTLLLHADLVYATADARFCLPFVNLGLCPEFASSFLLPKLVGHVKACEWLLLGEVFNGNDAVAAGLINAVVEDPLAAAQLSCAKLAKQPPAALRATKALIKSSLVAETSNVMATEWAGFVEMLQGAEFKEASSAFFAKRPADFSAFK